MSNSGRTRLPGPQSWLDLLDRTFFVYRENFTGFIVPVALVAIPIAIINVVTSLISANILLESPLLVADDSFITSPEMQAATLSAALSDMLTLVLLSVGSALVVALLQGVFANSTVTYMASEVHLGRQTTLQEAVQAVRGRLLPLALGLLVWWVILIGLSMGAMIITVACFLFVFAIGVVVFAGVVLYGFLTPILTLEPVTVGQGLQRAWQLGKARLWALVGFLLAIIIVSGVASSALTTLVDLIITPTFGALSLEASLVVQNLMASVIGVFIAPVLPIGLTLLYYDTRVRYEGLDILLDLTTDVTEPRLTDMQTPPPSGKFLTRQDMINIGAITGLLFGMSLVLILITGLVS